jgi:mRNA-degrading endonuclease RelE of RelBE toxin-antitoxin system
VIIVETRVFTTRIDELLSSDDYCALQLELLARPDQGNVIPGSGGLRKLRWSATGRGKRGGTRIIYHWHPASHRIILLFVYAKNERDDLTPSQREALRRIIEAEYP